MDTLMKPKSLAKLLTLAPFLYVLFQIIESKITFYAVDQKVTFYGYEFVLLWLLLAPFVFMLPSTELRSLKLSRKLYWISVIAIVTLIVLVALLIIAKG